MDITLLCYIVTACGLIFLALALGVYAFGKKSPGKQDEPERIKLGKNIDLKTSQVFSVILLTAVLAALPLVLIYLKPDLVKPADTEFLSLKDLNLNIYGGAVLEDGRFAKAVDIEVIRTYKEKVDTLKFQTDEQGQFLVKIPQAKPDEEYRISWTKSGYAMENRRFFFNAYPCAIRLSKGGDN